jgi:hypothetical protein
MAGFLVEYPLLSKSDWLNVSAAIEYREGVSVQQNTRPIVGE